MNKGEVYEGLYFDDLRKARNYIKFRHPKKRFKEPFKNTFVCTYTGMKFVFQELKKAVSVNRLECECHLQLNQCTGMCEHLIDKYEGRLRKEQQNGN
jgi:hypothetical protein